MSQRPRPSISTASEDILALVDCERYPIHDLQSAGGTAFLSECVAHMAAHGWCSFDGFIRAGALPLLAAEAAALLPQAEALTITRNIYGGAADRSAPPGDPRRREITHHALQLASDQIAADTYVSRLYRSDILTDFIRRIEGKDQLHRSADEFRALSIVALEPGSWQGWHYDHDECVVTLLLQAADEGGEFMFIPGSRTKDSEDTGRVEKLLTGDLGPATTLGRDAGTLTLFRGEFSLHGVTRIEGSRPRITAIFTYDEEPGRTSTDDINIRIYGKRVERILADREVQ